MAEDKKTDKIKTPLKKIKTEKPKITKKEVSKEAGEKATQKKVVKPEKAADFAVIRTGGKQYIVRTGEKLRVEKLDLEEGKTAKFDDVLLVKKGSKVEVGTPKVSGVTIEAKVLSQTKDDKVVVFKYKKRKNYRRKQGHRQKLTEVEIVKI